MARIKRKFPSEDRWVSWMTENHISESNAQKYAKLFIKDDVDLDILDGYMKISRSISEGDACRLRKILRQIPEEKDQHITQGIPENSEPSLPSSIFHYKTPTVLELKKEQLEENEPEEEEEEYVEEEEEEEEEEEADVEDLKKEISPKKKLKKLKKASSWRRMVVQALETLGGSGSYHKVCDFIEDQYPSITQRHASWRKSVSNSIRRYSSHNIWTQDEHSKLYILSHGYKSFQKINFDDPKEEEKQETEPIPPNESENSDWSSEDDETSTSPKCWSDVIYQALIALGGKGSYSMITTYIRDNCQHLIKTRRSWETTIAGTLSANKKNQWTKERIDNGNERAFSTRYLYVVNPSISTKEQKKS